MPQNTRSGSILGHCLLRCSLPVCCYPGASRHCLLPTHRETEIQGSLEPCFPELIHVEVVTSSGPMNPLSKLRRLPLSKHQSSPIRSLALQLACFRSSPGTLEPAQCLAQRLVLMAFHDELVCAQLPEEHTYRKTRAQNPLAPSPPLSHPQGGV